MKKILLSIVFVAIAAASVNAQANKVWDFSSLLTSDASYATDPTVSVVNLVPNELMLLSLKFAVDNTASTSMKKWTTGSYHTRLKTGGSGGINEANAVAIKVAGNSTIQVCAVSSSGSAIRKLVVAKADGTIVGSALVDGNAGKDATVAPPTFNYVGGEAVIYIYSAQNDESAPDNGTYTAGGLNLYMISATNTLAISESDLASSAGMVLAESGIHYNGNEVVNSKNLTIQIYNTLGKLVGTSNADFSTNDLVKGIYIVRAEGVKGALKFVK